MKLLKMMLFPIILVIFLFINTDMSFRINQNLLQAVTFSLVAYLLILRSSYKKFFLIISNSFLVFMAMFFIFNNIELANFFGSLGFGIFLLSLIFYIPQIVKSGYIRDLNQNGE